MSRKVACYSYDMRSHWRSIRNQAQVKQPGGANRDVWIQSRRPGTSSLSHFNARPYRGLSSRARWHKEAHNAWGDDKIHRGKKSGSTLCGTWGRVGPYLEKPPCSVNVKKKMSFFIVAVAWFDKKHTFAKMFEKNMEVTVQLKNTKIKEKHCSESHSYW